MDNANIYRLNRDRITANQPTPLVSPPSSAGKPKLLDQVRQAIRTRHYSIKTEEAYVGWFIFFHNKRHPVEMTEMEIGQFLSSLATDRRVSASTQNQALNALLFLYNHVVKKKIGLIEGVVRAKRSRRLPVVLSKDEVKTILKNLGVESLYSAFLMQKRANEYNFGRGAKVQTRGQTRYLFIMVGVDLVRDFLLNNQLDYSLSSISAAIAKLHAGAYLRNFGDAAVQLIDDYLTNGNEDCLFLEPEFQKMQDLNAFLKSDKLGKGEDFSPRLRTQIARQRRFSARALPSLR